MKEKIKWLINFISNPFVLAFLLSTSFIFFPVVKIEKYKAQLLEQIPHGYKEHLFYEDLNNDGNSDEIHLIEGEPSHIGILIEDNDETVLDQWNFEGSIKNHFNLAFANLSITENKSVLLFIHKNDSLFLNAFCPYEDTFLLENRFISKVFKVNGTYDYTCQLIDVHDLDQDGVNEIYFSIEAGFSAYPRQFFCYNFKKDTLMVSPNGANSFSYIFKLDIDNDGIAEYVTEKTNAVCNTKEDTIYSDFYTWLIVFNPDLSFKFTPIKLGYKSSEARITYISQKNKKYLVALVVENGIDNKKSYLAKFNSKGQCILKKPLENEQLYYNDAGIFNIDNTLFLAGGNDVFQLDSNLDNTLVAKYPVFYDSKFNHFDIDNDGIKERVFKGDFEDRIYIFKEGFKHPAIFKFDKREQLRYANQILNNGKTESLYLEGIDIGYFIKYFPNPLFQYRIGIYLALYLVILSIVILITKSQQYRAKLKQIQLSKIAELQLKTATNQIEPHLALNILENLASLFVKNDKEKAEKLFSSYSRMMRNTLVNSDKILVSLVEELNYIKDYLNLQQLRFGNKFTFSISFQQDENNEVRVPKMLLYTFIENAVKHGLRHLDKEGHIEVSIKDANGNYIVAITDNGIGRQKAAEFSRFSTAKGLKIVDEIIHYFKKEKKLDISYEIHDLKTETGLAAGTKILVTIPKK